MKFKEFTKFVQTANKALPKLQKLYACKSAEAVADFLYKEKCFGEVNNEKECPLAVFLKKLGLKNATAHPITMYMSKDRWENFELELTTAMRKFIQKFDDLETWTGNNDKEETCAELPKYAKFARLMKK